jgi:hypothetical protein
MVRLTSSFSLCLTSDPSDVHEHGIRGSHCGQAHFANTGPFGATCGDCVFLGYYQQRRNKTGDTTHAVYRGGCKKFHELPGKHGPIVPANASACKYFEKRDE